MSEDVKNVLDEQFEDEVAKYTAELQEKKNNKNKKRMGISN